MSKARKRKSPFPPYMNWRDGRPRWVPGPKLRAAGWKGRDLRDEAGAFLGLADAIKAAETLNAQVAAGRAGEGKQPARPRKTERTLEALHDKWIMSPKFGRLAASTQRDYRQKAKIFLAEFGDEPLAAIASHHIYNYWQREYEQRGHHMANGIIAVARAMLSHAKRIGWRADNPARELGLDTCAPRVAFWSPAKVLAFVETADEIGLPFVGDAVVIGLHSGQRRGDVLAMPPRIFDEQRLMLTQFKRGAIIDAPMTPPMLARAEAIRKRWRDCGRIACETMVANHRNGARISGSYLAQKFRAVRAEAVRWHPETMEAARMQPGLHELRYQDLRDTAVTRLAQANCNLQQIATITGHQHQHITSVMRHYMATTQSMADEAIGLLVSWMDREGIAL